MGEKRTSARKESFPWLPRKKSTATRAAEVVLFVSQNKSWASTYSTPSLSYNSFAEFNPSNHKRRHTSKSADNNLPGNLRLRRIYGSRDVVNRRRCCQRLETVRFDDEGILFVWVSGNEIKNSRFWMLSCDYSAAVEDGVGAGRDQHACTNWTLHSLSLSQVFDRRRNWFLEKFYQHNSPPQLCWEPGAVWCMCNYVHQTALDTTFLCIEQLRRQLYPKL